MQVHLYGHECNTLPMNSCAVPETQMCAEQPSWCAIRAGGAVVVLRMKIDSNVAAGDAVANHWVINALRIPSGTFLSLGLVNVSNPNPNQLTNVQLDFVAHMSQKHWDEVAYNGPLVVPHLWSTTCPTSLKAALIENHCKLVLMGSALCDGAVVAVQALDSLLIFRVGLPAAEAKQDTSTISAILADALCEYHITIPSASPAEPQQAHNLAMNTPAPSELSFLPALSTVQCICTGVFAGEPSGTRSKGLAKSMLISAPQGGGKSHLLGAIAKVSAHTLAPTNVDIIELSCADLVQSNKAQREELASEGDHDNTAARSTESLVRSNLVIVLRMLGCSADKCERILRSSAAGMPQLLILLDDIDCVFSRYSNSKDDNIPHASDGDTYKQLGYHLGIVLSELSKVDCSLPVVIVAATRKSSAQLLRGHTGCPEFERCLELSSPTYSERVIILDKQLALSGLHLQPLDVTDAAPTSTTRRIWAERLAGLTAGYLPGDLHSVVQRMGLLHRGKLAAVLHQQLRDHAPHDLQAHKSSAQDRTVKWNCALEAVVAIVPRQLHGLSAQSGRQGAGGRLGWQDFAGYSELIADLKRRLLPRTVSLQVSTTAESSDLTAVSAQKSSTGVSTLKASVLRGLVLYGPTGCGKTLLASVITSELKMNFVSVRSTDLLSKYFGETENTIRNLFRKARSAAPCVLFFDDFDSLAHKRSAGDSDGSTSNGLHGRILSTFLNELDGIMSGSAGSVGAGSASASESQILVIAACQDLTNLDEALIRPGRLQHHVFLREPRAEDIRAILQRYLGKLNCAPGLDTEPAVAALSSAAASASEVECFVRNAFMHALRETIHDIEAPGTVSVSEGAGERGVILQKHIDQALQSLVSPLRDADQGQNNNSVVSVADEVPSAPAAPAFSWAGGFSAGI